MWVCVKMLWRSLKLVITIIIMFPLFHGHGGIPQWHIEMGAELAGDDNCGNEKSIHLNLNGGDSYIGENLHSERGFPMDVMLWIPIRIILENQLLPLKAAVAMLLLSSREKPSGHLWAFNSLRTGSHGPFIDDLPFKNGDNLTFNDYITLP